MLMSMRQCARYIGIPYQTLNNYRLRMVEDIPYIEVGSAKLVNPEVVRDILLAAGWRVFRPGAVSMTGCVDEEDIYNDPQEMLKGIEDGELDEENGEDDESGEDDENGEDDKDDEDDEDGEDGALVMV